MTCKYGSCLSQAPSARVVIRRVSPIEIRHRSWHLPVDMPLPLPFCRRPTPEF